MISVYPCDLRVLPVARTLATSAGITSAAREARGDSPEDSGQALQSEGPLHLQGREVMSISYDFSALKSVQIMEWKNGENFFILPYVPTPFLRYKTMEQQEAHRLVRDFKEGVQESIDVAAEWFLKAVDMSEESLRDRCQVRYVLTVPPSEAGTANIPCEEVAECIAQVFGWITYLPHALKRIHTVPKSSKARSRRERPSEEMHIASIAYEGPRITRGGRGYFLLLDDVFTHGTVSNACRKILLRDAGAHTYGMFLGRTA